MFSPPQQYMTVAEFAQALPTITALTVLLSVASFFLVIGVVRLTTDLIAFMERRAARRELERRTAQMHQANLDAGVYDDDEIPY